jgi:hypothetical protein
MSTILALLTPSRQGALEVVAVRLGAVTRIIKAAITAVLFERQGGHYTGQGILSQGAVGSR